jgi:hypothetical protein
VRQACDPYSSFDAQMNSSDKVSIKLDTHGTPAENLQRLITDCGVSPHKVCTHFRMKDATLTLRSQSWSKNYPQSLSPTR